MTELSTTYLGLALRNPLVASSSPAKISNINILNAGEITHIVIIHFKLVCTHTHTHKHIQTHTNRVFTVDTHKRVYGEIDLFPCSRECVYI